MRAKIATNLDFVIAKTRAIHSEMYEGERLAALLSNRALPELAHRLCPGETFADHIALERRLVEGLGNAIALIWKYLKAPQDKIFTVLAMRLQLENLKVVLRSRLTGVKPPGGLPEIPMPPMFHWPRLDTQAAQGLGTLQDIVGAVPDPTLRQAARQALAMFTESPVPLFLEASLDRGYYQLLVKTITELDGANRRELASLVRFEIDHYNLMLVLRCRVNHRIDAETVFRLSAPAVITRSQMAWVNAAARRDNAHDIISLAPATIQSALAGLAEDDFPALDRRLWQHYYGIASRVYHLSFFTVAGLYGFVALKRMELANLILIVEGVRYGMSPDQIQERFITPQG